MISSLLGALLRLLAMLPRPLSRRVGGLLGWLYAALARDSRQVVVTNIKHVQQGLEEAGVSLASPDAFARRSMQTAGLLVSEIALCWRGAPDSWRELINRVEGDDAIAALRIAHARQTGALLGGEPVAPGPGVLLLSPHLGNWELLNMYIGAEFGVTVLYDPPKVAALDPLIREARERTASRVLPIGPQGLRGMVQQLRRGGVVGLLPDQVPAVDAGVYAGFLGKQALTINLVHRLANRHAPRVFLVCALRNTSGTFDINFQELTHEIVGRSELSAATAMNKAIAAQVVQAPEQYQWTYKRFKRPAGGGPSIYKNLAPPEGRGE